MEDSQEQQSVNKDKTNSLFKIVIIMISVYMLTIVGLTIFLFVDKREQNQKNIYGDCLYSATDILE